MQPDGTVSQHTEIFEPGYLVEELPLRDSLTFAMLYGWWIQLVLTVFGVAGAGYAWWTKRQPKNRRGDAKSAKATSATKL